MKQTFLAIAFATFAIGSFANTPKTEAKGEKPATTQSGTAVYKYIGGPTDDVNDPNNYELTPLANPIGECPDPGEYRCAATFQTNGSNQRTGNPQLPVYTKNSPE